MEQEPQAGIRGGQGASLVLNTENMRLPFWFLLAVVLSMELGESGVWPLSLLPLLSFKPGPLLTLWGVPLSFLLSPSLTPKTLPIYDPLSSATGLRRSLNPLLWTP